jgi:hypothetical protein
MSGSSPMNANAFKHQVFPIYPNPLGSMAGKHPVSIHVQVVWVSCQRYTLSQPITRISKKKVKVEVEVENKVENKVEKR